MNRRTRIRRITPLRADPAKPLRRSGPVKTKDAAARETGASRNTASRARGTLAGGKPIRPVSPKRRKENRERAAMADRLWPDRREGTVMCFIPWCDLPAMDLNEILPRGRGGSITDEENCRPACRGHNEELTKSPAWAYRIGALKHDGVCCRGRDVCAQYEEAA